MRPTTTRAAEVEKQVPTFQAARMHQCHFLEVDPPEVQLQVLADPVDIPVNSQGFWADTCSLPFIYSGAFVSDSFLERPFSVMSKAPKVLVSSLCVKQDLVITKLERSPGRDGIFPL